MNFETWRARVVEVATHLSDPGFQELTWFGKSADAISSPEELINQFFGDVQFVEFLAIHRNRLSESQVSAASILIQRLDNYCKRRPDSLDPAAVINDSEWKEILVAASSFLAAMDPAP